MNPLPFLDAARLWLQSTELGVNIEDIWTAHCSGLPGFYQHGSYFQTERLFYAVRSVPRPRV